MPYELLDERLGMGRGLAHDHNRGRIGLRLQDPWLQTADAHARAATARPAHAGAAPDREALVAAVAHPRARGADAQPSSSAHC